MNKSNKNTAGLAEIHHFTVIVDDVRKTVKDWVACNVCRVIRCDDDWALLRFKNIFMAVLKKGGKHGQHVGLVQSEELWNKQIGVRAFVTHRDGSEAYFLTKAIADIPVEVLREKSLTSDLKLS